MSNYLKLELAIDEPNAKTSSDELHFPPSDYVVDTDILSRLFNLTVKQEVFYCFNITIDIEQKVNGNTVLKKRFYRNLGDTTSADEASVALKEFTRVIREACETLERANFLAQKYTRCTKADVA